MIGILPIVFRDAAHKEQYQRERGIEPFQTRSAASQPSDDAHPASENEPEGTSRPLASFDATATGLSSFSFKRLTPSEKTNQPYCTQACLFGLAQGGPLDNNCPNVKAHGNEHMDMHKFHNWLIFQLFMDQGGVQCVPLHPAGSRGRLFKLRLVSHGYTLVAKAADSANCGYLWYEGLAYNHLRSLQGRFITTSLGCVSLALPWKYDDRPYCHMLLLAWGGDALSDCVKKLPQTNITEGVGQALDGIHQLGVLHRDARMRNMLYNWETGSVMVVDFRQASPPYGHKLVRGRILKASIFSKIPKKQRSEMPQQYVQACKDEMTCAMRDLDGIYRMRLVNLLQPNDG